MDDTKHYKKSRIHMTMSQFDLQYTMDTLGPRSFFFVSRPGHGRWVRGSLWCSSPITSSPVVGTLVRSCPVRCWRLWWWVSDKGSTWWVMKTWWALDSKIIMWHFPKIIEYHTISFPQITFYLSFKMKDVFMKRQNLINCSPFSVFWGSG